MVEIRNLRADEIECKVGVAKEKGVSLLLYKTARTDMAILDETFGAENWKCDYKEIKGNLFCTISIWSEEKKEWIEKMDCGVESAFGDKEKGESSDAFKRAGFRVGIGRELYTAPFIWIKAGDVDIDKISRGGKDVYTTYDKFEVKSISYDENGNIDQLDIIRSSDKHMVFSMGKKVVDKPTNTAMTADVKKAIDAIRGTNDYSELKSLWSGLPAEVKKVAIVLEECKKKKEEF